MARVRILLEYDGPEKEVDLAESLASGPTSSHLRVTGTPSAAPDSNGHFLFDRADPGQRESFDAAHMFAVAHDAIRMVRHELGASGGWAWGNGPGAALLLAAHRHPPEVTHYSRKHRTVFFSRPPGSDDGGKLFECRSLETVAHEVAHAVLDGLHPDWHVSPLHTEDRKSVV